ncbi:MAG: hypothetical protein ACTSQ4_02410 [Candidatus Heimdallarchaeaceae archaeon]
MKFEDKKQIARILTLLLAWVLSLSITMIGLLLVDGFTGLKETHREVFAIAFFGFLITGFFYFKDFLPILLFDEK